jgi:predicted permease
VFGPDEAAAPGGLPVAVISWHLWQTLFAGDPDILGRRLNLDLSPLSIGYYGPSRAYTVIGVMAPTFRGLASPWDPSEYWVPLVTRAADYWVGVPDGTVGKPSDPVGLTPVLMVGRRRPGVSLDRAQVVIETLGQGLEREVRTRIPAWGLTLTDAQRLRLPFDPQGLVVPSHFAAALMVVATALLSIAVANLVGLLLARGVTRRQEMVIRLTLGASRWRVARHVLTESLLLAFAGGSFGLVLSRWLVGVVLLKTPSQYGGFEQYRVALDVPLDWRVLAFSFALCLLAGLATGLGPARQAATTDLAAGLAGGATATSRHTRGRLRHAVIIPQVAGSLMLLVVAGVFVQALWRAESAAPGYNPTGVVLLSFDRPMPDSSHFSTADRAAWNAALRDANRRMLERIGATPYVSSASLLSGGSGQGLPLSPQQGWAISRDAFDAGTHHWVSRADVSPGYFAALSITVKRGRLFDPHDASGAPLVVVVSDTLAEWFWPGANPIGRYVAFHEPRSPRAPDWLEVVGVVESVTPPLSERPSAAIYVPFDQSPSQYATTVVARGSGSPASLIRDLTAAIHAADGTTMVSGSRTMEAAIDAVLFTRRFAVVLVGAAGVMGLLLALVGLYGVVSHSVAQRVRELGIRATLGATRADIVRLILREGAIVVFVGCGLGLLLALVALHLTARLVVAMPPADGALCALVAALIGGVVLMACYLPARRAARADPMAALRQS